MIIMRYFFHVVHDDCSIRDHEGSEYPDIDSALVEAVDSARELMSSAVRKGHDMSDRTFEILDEDSRIVLRMPFKEAMRVVV